MSGPLDEVRRAIRVIADAKRTIICPPGMKQPIRDLIDTQGLLGFFDIVESEHVPSDTVLIFKKPHSADDPWEHYLTMRGVAT